MKKILNNNERGQALVIIALAAISLFAFAALAIDGSNVFSDRRHAQNAADTSALDAALVVVRQGSSGPWESEGLARAASNGYNDDVTTNNVEVHYPPIDGVYAGDYDYIQVKITSHVDMLFARVIGINQVTNRVEAVTRVTVPEVTPWFDGEALVSTMEGCKPTGYPNDPFTIGGNALTVVNGSGIFVNSNCSNAFTVNGASSSTIATDGGICVVGGATYNPSTVDPDPQTGCGSQKDPDQYKLPSVSCGSKVGSVTKNPVTGEWEATPGNFNSTFPGVAPSGTLRLKKGIYCLNNGISLSSTWFVTSDLNDNDSRDADEGVLFYIPNGDITFNGTSDIEIFAVNSTFDNFPADLVNYLMYIPPTNDCKLKITGNDGSQFTGTILAPACHVTLEGSGGTIGVDSQIIGYSVAIGGSGNLDLTFNQNNNAVTTTNPGIEVAQ